MRTAYFVAFFYFTIALHIKIYIVSTIERTLFDAISSLLLSISSITILRTFLLGKVQFSQEARCTSWPELITQAAVISRKAFNVKLGLRRPVGDRGANRGCVCLIYNSRASQPALANVYTPFFFQN